MTDLVANAQLMQESRRTLLANAKRLIIEDPDFVLTDPEIMRALLAPTEDGANSGRQVLDLRAALIERLERRLARLQEAHRDIVDAAWENLSTLEQHHQATLAMLESDSLGQAATIVQSRLPAIMDLRAARLCVEESMTLSANEDASAITRVADGFIANRLADGDLIDGRLLFSNLRSQTVPGVEIAVFEFEAEHIRSAAYILIGGDGGEATAFLALGSEDVGAYSAGRNADLLKFMGAAIEKRLRGFGVMSKS